MTVQQIFDHIKKLSTEDKKALFKLIIKPGGDISTFDDPPTGEIGDGIAPDKDGKCPTGYYKSSSDGLCYKDVG